MFAGVGKAEEHGFPEGREKCQCRVTIELDVADVEVANSPEMAKSQILNSRQCGKPSRRLRCLKSQIPKDIFLGVDGIAGFGKTRLPTIISRTLPAARDQMG